MGVDVARYGDDETIISTNVGGDIQIPVIRHGQSLMTTVGDIVMQYKLLIAKYPKYKGVITVNIDDTGLGGGVTDRLEEVKTEERLWRLEIVPVNFGSKPPSDGSDERYQDISTYMWAVLKILMENREVRIQNDEELVAQLSVRKYSITSTGKIMLESKKSMKDRGIKSPDRADAVVLSCFAQNKVYSSFVDRAEAVIIPFEAVNAMQIQQINIGISLGKSAVGTSMVATAIIAGHKRAVVLAAERYDGEVETDIIGKKFRDFANMISQKYRRLDYVYCDSTEQFLYRCIKNAAESYRIPVVVRMAADDDVNNRIRLTTRLLTQNRLFLTVDCDVLARAFSTAIWSGSKSENSRSSSDSNIDGIKQSVTDWEQKYNDDTEALKQQLAKQERDHCLDMFLGGYKFSSKAAEDGIRAEFERKNFPFEEGKFLGAKEYMDGLMTNDDYKAAFAVEAPPVEEPHSDPKPRFSDPNPQKPEPTPKVSLAELMKRKNENPNAEVKFN